MMKVLYAITHDSSAQNFLRGQLSYMAQRGLEVHLSCSPGPGLDAIAESDSPHLHPLPTQRDIAPLRDFVSFVRYVRLVARLRPDAVHASTPKAALLALTVARLLRVNTRMYLIRGLRLETTTGVKRWLLGTMERVTCWAATDVVAVSPSLRDEYRSRGLNGKHQVAVFGAGSSNGVDVTAFSKTKISQRSARNALLLTSDKVSVTFIGRINRDKGADTFLAMIEQLAHRRDAVFLMQGTEEDPDLLRRGHEGLPLTVRSWGSVSELLAATDLLVLPTLREGFPNVVLEAACMGIPAVTTTATGARDSVVHGVTGLLVPPGDVHALTEAVERLLKDPHLRNQLGTAARERAVRDFRPEAVWGPAYDVLTSRGRPRDKEHR